MIKCILCLNFTLFIFLHILSTTLDKQSYVISFNLHSIFMKCVWKIWVSWGLNFKD